MGFESRRTLRRAAAATLVLLGAIGLYGAATYLNLNPLHEVGEVVDEFNGIPVYYNGGVQHSAGRHQAPNGYNLGIRYQCVEFVKRYYHQRLHHTMPEARGHAKSFFDPTVADGALNAQRMLVQHINGGASSPRAEDLIVWGPWLFNPYGHVAIVSRVEAGFIEVVQQNPGPYGSSREIVPLSQDAQGRWWVGHDRVRGWLRMADRSEGHASAPGAAHQ